MDLDKRFEKLLVKTENIALIEAYTALKKQTINAMNDAIKAIDVLERALEKAETSSSNCNIPHVSGSYSEEDMINAYKAGYSGNPFLSEKWVKNYR